MKNNMLYKLESLRGIAALMVLIFHSGISIYEEDILFTKGAWLFVDFFFVLSGFVMCLAYRQKINNGLSFKDYILARFFRLFPLHLFALLSVVPLIGFKYYYFYSGYGGTDPAITENATTFLTTLFLVNSLGFEGGWNNASWSISAEFVAYIAFYFLISFTVKRQKVLVSSVFIAIVVYLISYSYFGVFSPLTWDYGFLRSIPAFFLGVALFIFYSSYPVTERVLAQEFIAALFLVASISLTSINSWYAYVSIVSFIYCVYIFSSQKNGLLGNVLSMRIPKLLGKYSYSIYMMHMLVIIVFEDFIEHVLGVPFQSIHGIAAFLINTLLLVTVVILAHFTYTFIEKPGRDFGKIFVNRKK